jgi:hypothetical protein
MQNSINNNVQKFGVTVSRFTNSPKYYSNEFNKLNLKIPDFKKNSKADQSKVAFGKSTK